MWTPFFISVLAFMQALGERTPPGPPKRVEAVFERASKESDVEGAGLILSSLLADETTMRAAFSTSVVLDERSVYVLFGGHWGPRAPVAWKDKRRLSRILVDSVSTKPVLIRSVIRADRYESYIIRRHPRGAATINGFPFFSYSPYADDLVEFLVEHLRKEAAHPAKAITSFDFGTSTKPPRILVTAEQRELDILCTWQTLCGACDRLDLIEKATTKNWRDRFAELDKWFQENRPYMLWDHGKSCIRIDEEARERGEPTSRKSRSIPELRPPWLPETR